MKQKLSSREVGLLLVIVVGLAAVVGLSRLIDSRRPAQDFTVAEDQLYLTGRTVRRLSLGFNGLAADWYWIRSLQYIGHKVLTSDQDLQLDNLGNQLDLRLLAPLIDTATTLDPQFLAPYEYAAVVLPGIDGAEAIRITRKGVDANPSAWRLRQHLGYIYWKQHNYEAAGEEYGEASKLPGAPAWMQAMKAQMASSGGSRETAMQIYRRMYEESNDPNVKEVARKRAFQVQSFNERDAIRSILSSYEKLAGRCPSSWRQINEPLRQARLRLDPVGNPLDPENSPYRLTKNGCDVDLDPNSQVLRF